MGTARYHSDRNHRLGTRRLRYQVQAKNTTYLLGLLESDLGKEGSEHAGPAALHPVTGLGRQT